MAGIVRIRAQQKARVRYWTQGHGGCTTAAVLAREPVWAGSGLAALGLRPGGRVEAEEAQRLVEGRHPHTGQLLRPLRMEAHPRAKLDGALFAAALRARAAEQGLEPEQLLTSRRSRERWGRLDRALAHVEGRGQGGPKRKRTAVGDTFVPYVDLRRLAKDAGLRLEDVYDPAPLEFAWEHRDEQQSVAVGALALFAAVPKSLSAAAALAPPTVGEVIAQAVHETAQETVDAAEWLCGYASRGRQGRGVLSRQVDGRGLAAIVLPHALARLTKEGEPGDPHLHLHITFPTIVQGEADGKWGAWGSGGHELFRHVAVLGEFAKARLRHRLATRLGMRFAFEPPTGEWEVVGIPLALRRLWSSRQDEIWEQAGPQASAAARRVASAKLSRRGLRAMEWEPVVLLERWHAQAATVVGDVPAMFAAAVPGTTGQPAPAPTPAEVAARLQLPRRTAKRANGAEYREVLAAVIKAFPDNLTSLRQALEMTDQVLATAGFQRLDYTPGTGFRAAGRYRVPPALVAASRTPIDRTAVRTPRTTTKNRKAAEQAQQPLALVLPAPVVPRRSGAPGPVAPPGAPADQLQLDFAVDQAAVDPVGEPSEQLRFEVPGEPEPDRRFRPVRDADLPAALAAAEAELAHALAEAAAHPLAAADVLTAATAGQGALAVALRLRRQRLEKAAVLGRAHTLMLDQAAADRTEAREDRRRAARLRDLAQEKTRNRFGREKKGFTTAQRTEALDLASTLETDGRARVRMSRDDARTLADRLTAHAKDLEDAATETELRAANLHETAAEQAKPQTVERAVLEDDWPPDDKAAEEQDEIAADVAAAERAAREQQELDQAAVEAARDAVAGLRAEQQRRAHLTVNERATEERLRYYDAQIAARAAQSAHPGRPAARAPHSAPQQSPGQSTGGARVKR